MLGLAIALLVIGVVLFILGLSGVGSFLIWIGVIIAVVALVLWVVTGIGSRGSRL
jgi:hypothetical protein